MDTNADNPMAVIRLGVCAMEKKAKSKPMKEILGRMAKFTHISVIVFEENMIINELIENWPIVDSLISFYSNGFPIEKAIEYSKLRKPYLINDLEYQYILMDRKRIYEMLEKNGVPVPRYFCVERRPGLPEPNLIEHDDAIEFEGEIFQKPFVEKPKSAEQHDIYIYFPSSAGGGSQRLFRKIGDRSSKYSPDSHIRTDGSYIYEDFMPTDGTDVKVYTIAEDYAHAEARKSPALDGKVERDSEGKEVRYPVILTPREKIIAKKVSTCVKQQICGFDLLRANGMSYVCDVNGFSFVKSSKKYYDDCSHILGVQVTRMFLPKLSAAGLAFQLTVPPDIPMVPTTCGTIMELRCVIAVIRHGDRTPKQKLKIEVRNKRFFNLFNKYSNNKKTELKLKRPAQLQEVLDIVRSLLDDLDSGRDSDPDVEEHKNKFEQLKYVLEMYGSFSGINRKIQLKYHDKCKNSEETGKKGKNKPKGPFINLIAKWGGELTEAGREQAEELGRAFRCIYPGGDGNYSKDPGLGLLRLHSTYRHDLKIYASDEGRVQMTAAAFTKGFLALEGELPPILVQMVKSANTNGLLDNDNDCRNFQQIVKKQIKEVMSKRADFTEADIQRMTPTGSKSIANAMRFVKNPHDACEQLYQHVKHLAERVSQMSVSCRSNFRLYQSESWDLLTRRWNKLLKEFRQSNGEFDLSKISDIYDNIKYDVHHNPHILIEDEIRSFFTCAKALADIIVPQEYGITKEEKLAIGQRICTPLMRKILADARYTDVDECTRLHAGYSKGVASPERFVRTRLYFTSESHLHSLLTCLRFGGLVNMENDEQWKRAMDFVSSVSELNYLSQIVVMIYEDPTAEVKTEKRFHVEVHFSPGAYALLHDIPEGSGFRSGNLQRLNSLNSIVNESNSPFPLSELSSQTSNEPQLTLRSNSCIDKDAFFNEGSLSSNSSNNSSFLSLTRQQSFQVQNSSIGSSNHESIRKKALSVRSETTTVLGTSPISEDAPLSTTKTLNSNFDEHLPDGYKPKIRKKSKSDSEQDFLRNISQLDNFHGDRKKSLSALREEVAKVTENIRPTSRFMVVRLPESAAKQSEHEQVLLNDKKETKVGQVRTRINSTGPSIATKVCLSPLCRSAKQARKISQHRVEEISHSNITKYRQSISLDSLCTKKVFELYTRDRPFLQDWLRENNSCCQQEYFISNPRKKETATKTATETEKKFDNNNKTETDSLIVTKGFLASPQYRKSNSTLDLYHREIFESDDKHDEIAIENKKFNNTFTIGPDYAKKASLDYIKTCCMNTTKASEIHRPRSKSREEHPENNEGFGTLTYPNGVISTYHLDISRLLRVLGMPAPNSAHRSQGLISTAIIRGCKFDLPSLRMTHTSSSNTVTNQRPVQFTNACSNHNDCHLHRLKLHGLTCSRQTSVPDPFINLNNSDDLETSTLKSANSTELSRKDSPAALSTNTDNTTTSVDVMCCLCSANCCCSYNCRDNTECSQKHQEMKMSEHDGNIEPLIPGNLGSGGHYEDFSKGLINANLEVNLNNTKIDNLPRDFVEDIQVPSAPSVPNLYPLETLHNALTLNELEAFLLRLVTTQFPSPFPNGGPPPAPPSTASVMRMNEFISRRRRDDSSLSLRRSASMSSARIDNFAKNSFDSS